MFSIKLFRFKKLIAIVLILVTLLTVLYYKQSNVTLETADKLDVSNRDDHHTKRLAVIVPFRDRFDELLTFVPYLSQFIRAQNIKAFSIYILNQSSRYRFNRGALTNVGYLLTKDNSDYIAIHDVDLLPENKNLSYAFPENGPHHLSSSEYHPQYSYNAYFGGILLISNEHFEKVNGMSNRYFGWGLEDDEFFTRIQEANLQIFKPKNLTTNRTNTFLHIHHHRKRDTFKTKEQKEVLRRRDRETGLKDLKYSVNSRHSLVIDDERCTVFNIELFCEIKKTPWCLHSATSTSTKKVK